MLRPNGNRKLKIGLVKPLCRSRCRAFLARCANHRIRADTPQNRPIRVALRWCRNMGPGPRLLKSLRLLVLPLVVVLATLALPAVAQAQEAPADTAPAIGAPLALPNV